MALSTHRVTVCVLWVAVYEAAPSIVSDGVHVPVNNKLSPTSPCTRKTPAVPVMAATACGLKVMLLPRPAPKPVYCKSMVSMPVMLGMLVFEVKSTLASLTAKVSFSATLTCTVSVTALPPAGV